MLNLSRKVGESLVLNDDIKITITSIYNRKTRIGFSVPAYLPIIRSELYHRDNFINQPSILFVEDNELIHKITYSLLDSLNCKVDIACNGDTALKLFKSNKYDLVLLDFELPDILGIEVCKLFRQIEKEGNTPIIFQTSRSDKKKECLNSGANDFIEKPIDKNKMLEVIQRWLPNYPTTLKFTEKN